MKLSNFILAMLLFTYSFLFAQNPVTIEKYIKENSQSKLLKNAQWSIYAAYCKTGKEIVSHNKFMSMTPASGLKLITTAAAIYYLGKDFTFETKIYHDGIIDSEGVLQGNIYFVGGGDPTFGSDLIPSSLSLTKTFKQIITTFNSKGIKSISGNIFTDELFFDNSAISDYWSWIDIGNYYGAGTSALSINDNLYYLYFKPADKVGAPAEILRTEPEINNLKFINYMKTGKKGSGDNGYIYNAPYNYNAVLRGTIPAGVDEFSIKGSIPDPAKFAGEYLHKSLTNSGISISGDIKKAENTFQYDESKLIYTHQSPKLIEIIEIVNKKSFNFYAEQLLRMIGKYKYNEGSVESGVKAVENFLDELGISSNGLNLFDGSGLSPANTITTEIMVKMLSKFYNNFKFFNDYYNSISLAGDPHDIGFFKNFAEGTPVELNARIKSGSINLVRSYSGYLKDSKGKMIAFSLIANNYSGSSAEINNIHKEIIIMLSKL